MDPKNLSGKFPWITKEGFFDPAQFPIDGVLNQALSDDDQQFRSGLNLLQSMYVHGRQEAGVFLLGLLVTCEDDWERRIRIVEALKGIGTKPCAELLFGELKRIKSFEHDPALSGVCYQGPGFHALGIDRGGVRVAGPGQVVLPEDAGQVQGRTAKRP